MMSEWADQLDQVWRSPAFPVWLLLAVAGFLGMILLATLLRAERSIANDTLAGLTVLAIAITIIVLFRGNAGPDTATPGPGTQNAVSLPALACLDNLAGETVLNACERLLFASPDSAAAAVAHTVAQLNRLKSYGDVASANRVMTPDLDALRRAIERDRYGLVAYVLMVRDRCQPEQCAAYASLTDHIQIASNMAEGTYEAAIDKYAATWNAPPVVVGAGSLMAPTQPTGKPNNVDFPSSSSIPPVSIMTGEPPVSSVPRSQASPLASKKQSGAAKKQATPSPPPPSSTASSPTTTTREP